MWTLTLLMPYRPPLLSKLIGPWSSATTASRPDSLEEQAQDARGRAPDHLVGDQVGVGLDGDAPADETALLVCGLQVVEGGDQDALHLRGVGLEAHALVDQADERVDLVVGDE